VAYAPVRSLSVEEKLRLRAGQSQPTYFPDREELTALAGFTCLRPLISSFRFYNKAVVLGATDAYDEGSAVGAFQRFPCRRSHGL
jgi:hypothetical protein